MILNLFNKAKNIIFEKGNSGLSATNVQDAIIEVNGRNKKVSVANQESITVDIKESCLLIWSQNTNCGGVVIVDKALNYTHKLVNKNDDVGNFSVIVSNGVLTLTNKLGGSVQCYILNY